MIRKEELVAMKAIALCHKPFLKPEEAMIYTDLGRTQFAKKCEDHFVYKSSTGYYKREDLDKMMAGAPPPITVSPRVINVGK
jgi:hypothetical protein